MSIDKFKNAHKMTFEIQVIKFQENFTDLKYLGLNR